MGYPDAHPSAVLRSYQPADEFRRILVESAWGAVRGLLPVRFPRPTQPQTTTRDGNGCARCTRPCADRLQLMSLRCNTAPSDHSAPPTEAVGRRFPVPLGGHAKRYRTPARGRSNVPA